MLSKPKQKYQQYTDEDLQNAVSATKNGSSMLKMAKKFHVPKSTVHDHLNDDSIGKAKMGRKPVLSGEQFNVVASFFL